MASSDDKEPGLQGSLEGPDDPEPGSLRAREALGGTRAHLSRRHRTVDHEQADTIRFAFPVYQSLQPTRHERFLEKRPHV